MFCVNIEFYRIKNTNRLIVKSDRLKSCLQGTP